jgi:hypothetical protein
MFGAGMPILADCFRVKHLGDGAPRAPVWHTITGSRRGAGAAQPRKDNKGMAGSTEVLER